MIEKVPRRCESRDKLALGLERMLEKSSSGLPAEIRKM